MAFLAYIDPGTGTMVWQAVMAVIAATVIFFRQTFGRAAGWIRKKISCDRKN
ncbi:MAG: hypothetical protein HYS56_03235 [Candidatus Omnitrophica bacterium]|nr:hypothetical protein [Candidatus Omnitrophota bacterium]